MSNTYQDATKQTFRTSCKVQEGSEQSDHHDNYGIFILYVTSLLLSYHSFRDRLIGEVLGGRLHYKSLSKNKRKQLRRILIESIDSLYEKVIYKDPSRLKDIPVS